MSSWPLCTQLFGFFPKLVTYLHTAFLLLSCSDVRQRHGEKSIPWIHLWIRLGTTWGTLTLTTWRGEGHRHRAGWGQVPSQSRREGRGQALWCFWLVTAFVGDCINPCAAPVLCLPSGLSTVQGRLGAALQKWPLVASMPGDLQDQDV